MYYYLNDISTYVEIHQYLFSTRTMPGDRWRLYGLQRLLLWGDTMQIYRWLGLWMQEFQYARYYFDQIMFYPKKGAYITVNTKNNRLMIRSIVLKKRNCVNAFSTIWMTFQHMFKVIIIYFLLVQCLEIGTGCTGCSNCCCEGTQCKHASGYDYECRIPTTELGILWTKYCL